jgi:hypothetical protein
MLLLAPKVLLQQQLLPMPQFAVVVTMLYRSDWERRVIAIMLLLRLFNDNSQDLV